jgi:hypothetical protein
MDNGQTPGLDVLETTLISTLHGFTSVYLVLDALDECLEIRLAHFSIKEYLISSRISQSPASIFSIHEIAAHAHITDSCLAYHLDRSKTILATEKEMKLFQLWEYAASYWARHLDHLSQTDTAAHTTNRILQIFKPGAQALLNMVQIGDLYNSIFSHFSLPVCKLALLLYYAASMGQLQFVELLITSVSND